MTPHIQSQCSSVIHPLRPPTLQQPTHHTVLPTSWADHRLVSFRFSPQSVVQKATRVRIIRSAFHTTILLSCPRVWFSSSHHHPTRIRYLLNKNVNTRPDTHCSASHPSPTPKKRVFILSMTNLFGTLDLGAKFAWVSTFALCLNYMLTANRIVLAGLFVGVVFLGYGRLLYNKRK